MADSKARALTAINQVRHFEVDSLILSNKAFNILMLQWGLIVGGTMATRVQMLDCFLMDRLEDFKRACLNRFLSDDISSAIDEFKEKLDAKVLKLSSKFILAEDKENAQFASDKPEYEGELLAKVVEIRLKIIQLRIRIETLKELKRIKA